MKRPFYVMHPHGGDVIIAETAAEAVRECFIPSGWRNALCVIDCDFVMRPEKTDTGAFVAFIGADFLKSRGNSFSPEMALEALKTPPRVSTQRPAASEPAAKLFRGSSTLLKHSRPGKTGKPA